MFLSNLFAVLRKDGKQEDVLEAYSEREVMARRFSEFLLVVSGFDFDKNWTQQVCENYVIIYLLSKIK